MKKIKNKKLIKGEKKEDRYKRHTINIGSAIGIAIGINALFNAFGGKATIKVTPHKQEAKIIDLNPEDYEEIKD